MIYLDHNATSPMLSSVFAAMRPWLGVPANPNSAHHAGQRAATAVEAAREQVASAVGATPDQVVFTSGASEANALALHIAVQRVGGAIACSKAEHPSVWKTAASLGWHELRVNEDGRTLLEPARILSLQAVNHETGVVQSDPRGHAGFVHVDGTQALGRVPLSFEGLDALSLSAHKLGGPPGVGALVVRGPAVESPLYRGGAQERGRRPGTVPTALVVGFGEAASRAAREREERVERWEMFRRHLEGSIRHHGGEILGAEVPRAANTVCAVFSGLVAESVVQALDLSGICASAGAACSSGSTGPSPVLEAMGHAEPRGGVRFSFGPETTIDDVTAVVERLGVILTQVRDAASWSDF